MKTRILSCTIKLNSLTQELTVSTDRNKDVISKLTEVQLMKEKSDQLLNEQTKKNEEQASVIQKQAEELEKQAQNIENQSKEIEKQGKEIDQLKITNKAFDISNKENFKNMNAVMEKMIYMSSERQKVKNELDNIIQRRKSVKNLA